MENLLTVAEAAPIVRMSERGLYRQIRLGNIPAIRIGNQIRIPENVLSAWIRLLLKVDEERVFSQLSRH